MVEFAISWFATAVFAMIVVVVWKHIWSPAWRHVHRLRRQQVPQVPNAASEDSAEVRDGARRDRARFECQLAYDQHAVELRNRFPRKRLSEYFECYMTNTHSVEEVEERAEQLKQLLLDSVEPQHRAKFTSISEVREFFQDERDAVLKSDWDEDTRQTLFAALNREEDLAIYEVSER